MPRPEEDSAFAAFQRTGQTGCLARVFDLCAPRLLIVAYHLARNAADAEDLVQATFVSAIESASRYDPAWPVMQWLAGILGNHARMARRRNARPIDTTRLRVSQELAPDDLLEAGELATRVSVALEGLPELYRSVLVLRLLHGLKPRQIAHALGRAPDAVRTQLHRGLEQLRQSLPRSMALPAAFLHGEDGRGLAVVRAAVLGKASGVAAPVLVVAAGGTLMAKQLLVAGGAVLLGGVLAYAAWLGLGAAALEPSSTPSAPAAAATRPALAGVEPGSAAAPRELRVVHSGATQGGSSALAMLTGRCIAAESGAPLVGARIQLVGTPAGAGRRTAWREPGAGLTGLAGRFAIAFDPPEQFRFEVEATAASRATLMARWSGWAPGAALDVGDVRFPATAQVRGRVLDRKDQPVAGVGLVVVAKLPFGSEAGERRTPSTRSAADGSLDAGALPLGIHRCEVVSQHALLSPTSVTVAVGGSADLIVRVLRPDEWPELAGVVVDEAGAALTGVEVSATRWRKDGSGGNTVGSAVSRSTGGFVLRGSCDPADRVRLDLAWHRSPLFQWQPGRDTEFAWGSRDLRLVVARKNVQTSGAVLRVVGPEDQPLEEFRLFVCPDRSRPTESYSSSDERRVALGHHALGELALPDLRPGPWMAIVYPGDDALPPSGPVLFATLPDQVSGVPVAIRTRASLRVRVVRRDGSAVAGTRVELLHAFGPKAPSLHSPVMRFERADATSFSTTHSDELSLLRDTSTTDAQGIALLHGPLGARELTVRVAAIECLGGLRGDVELTGSEVPVEVVVTGGAVLAGRVEPANLVAFHAQGAQRRTRGPGLPEDPPPFAWDPGLCLRPAGGSFGLMGPSSSPVAADGTFRITGIAAGTWDILILWRPPVFEGSTSGALFGPLATVSLADGETRTLTLDAMRYRPTSVRGRLLLNGQPMAGVTCWLGSQGEHQIRIGASPADQDGWFAVPVVMPGSYRLVVDLPHPDRGAVLLTAPELLRVGPAEQLERTFQLTRQRLLVTLVAGNGTTPLPQRTIVWSTQLGNMYPSGEFTTGADGTARIDPAPPLPITVALRDGNTPLGTIEPVLGQQEVRVTLRAPAAGR